MRILGVDPGLASTGVGVIERTDTGDWCLIHSADVRTNERQAMPERLARIHDLVQSTIRAHHPDEMAIESLFFARNVRSAVLMAHGRGVAMLAASEARVPISEYSPREIKQSVVGNGNAGKDQVMHMVRTLLKLESPPASDHQSDALATALAHAYRSRMAKAIGKVSESSANAEAKELLAKAFGRGRKRKSR
jgi:crossover junction endodeoxyribonuclease RuvC